MHGLGRQVESHPIQDLLPLRFRREEFRSLDVAAEDRIGQGRRRLLGAVDHDLDLARSDLPDDLSDPCEVRVEEERLPHRLVVDRRVREADLERPEVALADSEASADRAEPFRDGLHVIAQGEMVRQERLETALERLVIEPQQAVHQGVHVELAGVGDEFVQDPVGVRPPEPNEMFAREELLDQVAQSHVHDLAKRCMDDQEAVERLDHDPVVRRDGSAGLAVVRVLFHETLRAGLVDGPRFLEVLDGLGKALSVEPSINLLANPTDTLGEAERHGQHLAVPAGNHRVRVGHGAHVDHAVLPDLLDLPGATPDDEVQALAGLDDHELLPEDADLPLRREVHNRVAALVADRREVLEVIAAALGRDSNLVAFLADVSEVGEELGDAIRLGVLELTKRFGAPDRRQNLGPKGRAALVERGADDLVGEHIEGEAMDVQRLEIVFLCGLDRSERLYRVVRGHREDEPAGSAIERVARASDSLDQGRDLPRGIVLDDLVYRADVDAELKGRSRDETFDVATLEARLDALSLLPRERAVVDRDILADHGETRTKQLREWASVHEDEGRPTFVEGIVDRGEASSSLGRDVEVPGRVEVFVDRTRPLDLIFVSLLEPRDENLERGLPAKHRGDCVRVTDGRR